MIDTLVLEYTFQNYTFYESCYYNINVIARKLDKKHGSLHKRKSKEFKQKAYTTFAFSELGWRETMFYQSKHGSSIRIIVKPLRMMQQKCDLYLSKSSDYTKFEEEFNIVVAMLNKIAEYKMLPHLNEWRVTRIDYAVDFHTPFVNLYIDLFKCGYIPKGFHKLSESYPTSLYLISKGATINFYDKIAQIKQSKGYSDKDIINELGYKPEGILRLEVQCKPRIIAAIRQKYSITDHSLKSLWNPDIAAYVIKSKISSIIGKNNFFSSDIYFEYIKEKFPRHGFSKPYFGVGVTLLAQASKFKTLQAINELLKSSGKQVQAKYCTAISRIQKTNLNIIPLDCAKGSDELLQLVNPYKLIEPLIAKENGSHESALIENHFKYKEITDVY